jgi:DNA helicase-2/ATP-dependent DNA helicase PcrA
VNKEQEKAVKCIDKPVLIIAGPGCGKTYTICEKIIFLNKNNYSFKKILALTFTQKAGEEMTQRLEENSKGEFVGRTFHSFALELIEEDSYGFKLNPNFKLISDEEILYFFNENISNFDFSSDDLPKENSQKAQLFFSSISKLKDFGYTSRDMEKLELENFNKKLDLLNVYAAYEKYKLDRNFLDFGDLLIYLKNRLELDKNYRNKVKKRFSYILVDEFQDSNFIQLEILKLIADRNITVVADPKQSIYSFRGANYSNFNLFKQIFKDHEVIYLRENFRSSKKVLSLINRWIDLMEREEEKLLLMGREDGEVNNVRVENENSSNTYLIEKIRGILDVKPNSSIAILSRRKGELESISYNLNLYGVEHENLNGLKIFQNIYVKDIIFLLKIIKNPRNSSKELFHILTLVGVDEQFIASLSRKSSFEKKSLYDYCFSDSNESLEENYLLNSIGLKLKKGIELRDGRKSILEIVRFLISSFNLYEKAVISDNFEGIKSINFFLDFIKRFEELNSKSNLDKFLKLLYYSRNSYFDDEKNMVSRKNSISLMSIHQSKGKEFDYVFIPNLNDRKFPLQFKENYFDFNFEMDKNDFLEEEKRLFFVAISRAKKGVHLMYLKKSLENKYDSKKSLFLEKLNLPEYLYSNDISTLDKNLKEEIKLDIIRKINNYLVDLNFKAAENEINVLKAIFSKKDLNFFLNSNSEKKYENYERSLREGGIGGITLDFSNSIYSVSQLQMYESCPRKYLYSYIYKIPSKARHYFDFGTTLHSVLENLADMVEENSDEVELFSKGVELLSKNWISKGYENSSQEKEYYEKGIKIIKNFIKREKILKKDKRLTIEKELKFTIDIEGKKLTGFIDRIDKLENGSYEIIDYKTSNSMEKSYMIGRNMQLLLYSEALKRNFANFPKKIGLWYLIHDKLLQANFDEKNLSELKTKIKKIIERIESKNFKAKPGAFACKFCDFNDICTYSKFK